MAGKCFRPFFTEDLRLKSIKKNRAFTLIEIIIGIVVLSLVLMGSFSLLISQSDSYRDPLIQEKSVQIAKRVIHEIQIRAFDEHSDFGGGLIRCGETVMGVTYSDCTSVGDYGPDTGERLLESLDDVDDFHSEKLCLLLKDSIYECSADNFLPSLYFFADATSSDEQQALSAYYQDYGIHIEVVVADGMAESKKIVVTVRQSDGNEVGYEFVKANI